jgi:hypothetical protein
VEDEASVSAGVDVAVGVGVGTSLSETELASTTLAGRTTQPDVVAVKTAGRAAGPDTAKTVAKPITKPPASTATTVRQVSGTGIRKARAASSPGLDRSPASRLAFPRGPL